MSVCRKEVETEYLSPVPDAACVERIPATGNLIARALAFIIRAWREFQMSDFKKTLKAAAVAAVCGVGLCALARKLKLSRAVSDIAQSVEAVPFPGTRIYAFLAAKQLHPLYAAIADQLANANSFQRILDLGTGLGYLPIELARRRPELCIIGVDQAPDLIRIANANARAFRAKHDVEFRTGDPTNLPYPGRYFDLVVSVNVLHHWRDPLAIFEEVNHILVPGGQFWIYDYRKDVPKDIWDKMECRLSRLDRLALQFGPEASSRAAYSEDKLVELAQRANFVDISVEDQTLPAFGCDIPAFVRMILHKPSQQ